MSDDIRHQFDTLAIHSGADEHPHQAIDYPIFMSSAFYFTDMQQAEDTFTFERKAYVYTRGGNPTVNLFERRIAQLEGGADGVAFASGIAAITTVLFSLVQAGEQIVAHSTLYGSTRTSLSTLFKRFGITTTFIDLTDIDNIESHLSSNVKVIFFETPTNPALRIIDIKKIASIAKKHGIKVVVDNTFATPYLQKPLELGADVVVHSATKYLCGHGDSVAGVAVSKDPQYIASLKFEYLCELGGILSPFNAWLLLRGMKTLGIRMEKHLKSAAIIAQELEKTPQIEEVIYPGLASHPDHELAKEQMNGFGGVISFNLRGELKEAETFISKLKLITLSVSLGDAETLIQIPGLMTHRSYDFTQPNIHFSKKTVRISIGLEDPADILADIKQALAE